MNSASLKEGWWVLRPSPWPAAVLLREYCRMKYNEQNAWIFYFSVFPSYLSWKVRYKIPSGNLSQLFIWQCKKLLLLSQVCALGWAKRAGTGCPVRQSRGSLAVPAALAQWRVSGASAPRCAEPRAAWLSPQAAGQVAGASTAPSACTGQQQKAPGAGHHRQQQPQEVPWGTPGDASPSSLQQHLGTSHSCRCAVGKLQSHIVCLCDPSTCFQSHSKRLSCQERRTGYLTMWPVARYEHRRDEKVLWCASYS